MAHYDSGAGDRSAQFRSALALHELMRSLRNGQEKPRKKPIGRDIFGPQGEIFTIGTDGVLFQRKLRDPRRR